MKPLWNETAKQLGIDPKNIEDESLLKIVSGLFNIVDGIGNLRTQKGSAHGRGNEENSITPKSYRLEPRHARLAVHAAHTVTLFAIETWDKRRS